MKVKVKNIPRGTQTRVPFHNTSIYFNHYDEFSIGKIIEVRQLSNEVLVQDEGGCVLSFDWVEFIEA